MSEHEPVSAQVMRKLRQEQSPRILEISPLVYNHLISSGEHDGLWGKFWRLICQNRPLSEAQEVFVKARDEHRVAILKGSIASDSLRQTAR
ncbi:hypothetical protein A3B45_02160 [Candidatus Daviesbacteria bacterium RIFCSPLOWO2_01_FULL_39_12]|uniref:Uncharacterized protein n=1 Tax=Candidatus Daviesbacteria bacterium RIFCSPLOWO2_01_FULL_39_12 TaxID=1797785 RepID=A0A1F5KN71_9BACT|nr:MAG: hypothetical protein A3B45_02160 [Candidatus Daviesbacteria bacterium RIFCSPLOWO2_01_FULL_39_12]